MRLEHHLVGGYVRYISPYIIIIILYSQSSFKYIRYNRPFSHNPSTVRATKLHDPFKKHTLYANDIAHKFWLSLMWYTL